MTISLLYTCDQNNIVGKATSPWLFTEGLQHFENTTKGGVIVMGRNTWETLGDISLSDRVVVVLTRDLTYKSPGALVFHDVRQVLALHQSQREHSEFWIVGSLAEQFATHADRVVRTTLLQDCEGTKKFDLGKHVDILKFRRTKGSVRGSFYVPTLTYRIDEFQKLPFSDDAVVLSDDLKQSIDDWVSKHVLTKGTPKLTVQAYAEQLREDFCALRGTYPNVIVMDPQDSWLNDSFSGQFGPADKLLGMTVMTHKQLHSCVVLLHVDSNPGTITGYFYNLA